MSAGLSALLDRRLVFPLLEASDGVLVLRELAEKIVAEGLLDDADELFTSLREREELGSTGIGHGVAVPHCKIKGLKEVVLALGLAPVGIDFAAVDGEPVRAFFVVLSPPDAPAEHLRCLAAISKWVQQDGHLDRLFQAPGLEELVTLLTEPE